jgi:TPR repeat protein
MNEIARYHTAGELYETGVDYLNGTNGKPRMPEHAEKWLKAAADKGSTDAISLLKK